MWKKIAAVVLAGSLLTACADPKTINGVEYRPYGLVNMTDRKNPNVEYEVSIGNIFWSVFLAETIVAPIYFIGWSIMEPVGPKTPGQPH